MSLKEGEDVCSAEFIILFVYKVKAWFLIFSGLDNPGYDGDPGAKGERGEPGEPNNQSGVPGTLGLKGFQGPQG